MKLKLAAAGIFLVICAGQAAAQETAPVYVFSTLAGSAGVAGSADGTGTAARFKSPEGLGVDAEGNIYVADRGNSTVRKITPAGVVTTLAGKAGETGVVDGEGAEARFGATGLAGLAMDRTGNVFVTDSDAKPDGPYDPITNQTGIRVLPPGQLPVENPPQLNTSRGYLRKIAPNGTVDTIAGGGSYTTQRNPFSNLNSFGIFLGAPITYSGAYNDIGSGASFALPTGVSTDVQGAAFVIDFPWAHVRKVTTEGIVSTFVGNASARLPLVLLPTSVRDGPASTALLGVIDQIASIPSGGFYISTQTKVKSVSAAGFVTTVAGPTNGGYDNVDGVGPAARFGTISSLVVDRIGTVFLTDSRYHTLRMMTPEFSVTTIGGSQFNFGSVDGAGGVARFSSPKGIAVDEVGNLYIADTGNHTIRKATRATMPVIQTQPQAKFASAGQVVPLTAAATGFPEPTFQWSKNGGAIAGATGATLTLSSAQLADAGSYSVTATNAAGSTTSSPAVVTVGTVPVFGTQPREHTVEGGKGVTLTVLVSGTPTPTLQWRKDGVAIAGATGATLTLTRATASDAGSYTVVATNAAGAATSSVAVVTVGTSPAIATHPLAQTVAAGQRVTLTVAAIGTPAPTLQWRKDGVDIPGASGATLTLASAAVSDGGSYAVLATNVLGSLTSNAALVTVGTLPLIVTQPLAQTVAAGQRVTLTVAATGTPTPTLQWRKDGADIPGATGATLTLASATASDTGNYTVIATNVLGSFTSSAALVTVGTLPVFTTQPLAQTVAGGQSVVLTVAVPGTPAPTLQWRKDGVDIPGATGATLTVASAVASDAGIYSVAATNVLGTVGSNPAMLTVNTSRVVNLAIRSNLAAGGSLIVGFVVAGNGKPLLVRAVGPGLGQFGLGGVLADPRVNLFAGSAAIANNDNWGSAANAAQVAVTAGQVGAFGLPAGSLDAVLLTSLDGGGYSAQVLGPGNAGGIVLVELYDAASATAARLVNVSARTAVGTGENALLAGFTVTGNAKRTVLIRAIGPTLAVFGATGVLADPRLELVAQGVSTPFVTNDDWGGGATLAAAFGSVGAFPLAANAKDAALLVTLDPGSYSVQVAGVGGTTGEALVEIYEVP